jgi:hypothetical protein
MSAVATSAPVARRWTNEHLDRFRLIGDPEADAIAAALVETRGPRALTRLTRQLEDWEAPIPDDAPADLHDFFGRPVAYPAWVDPDVIAHAEDLFVSYGPVTTSLILLNGFPRFLVNQAGARAFYLARIFSPDSLRNRMLELGQFALYMTERGGMGQAWLSPAQAAAKRLPAHGVRKGRGLIALQKLRVIHANIRILLRLARANGGEGWNEATLGVPINQEDLADAVMCFALGTIEGLRKVGIEQTPEDQDALRIAWQAAGVLLGLTDDLQPTSLADAQDLRAAIFRRRARKTPEAAVLARELLHIVEALLPPGARRVTAAVMRYQLGDEISAMLELPNPRWLLRAIGLTRPLWGSTGAFARVSMLISPPLLRWVASRDRLGAPRRLELPPALADQLGTDR